MNERWNHLLKLALTVFLRGRNSSSKNHVIHIETPTEMIHYEKHPLKRQKIYFSQLGEPEDWKP